MNKPKVVIVSLADWAGSGHNVCRAINSVGEFECRHITTYDHAYEFPRDILVRLSVYDKTTQPEDLVKDAVNSPSYGEVSQLISEADIIHLWNTFPGEKSLMSVGFPIDWRKVKVVTMTGSMYRDHHTAINKILKEWNNLKVTVQDALFNFNHEIPSVFIPHAIDVDFFKPVEERDKSIGSYRTTYKSNVRFADKDIAKLSVILRKYPDWKIELNYSMSWKERIEKLSHCSIFIQDISPYIGIWGRSTLEACVLEVPSMENYSQQVLLNHENILGKPPIIKIDEDTFETKLVELMESETYRKDVGKKSREWVREHFSYPVIGKMYSDVYGSL